MSTEIMNLINSQRETFLAVRIDPSIEFDREVNFAMQILSASEFLMNVAQRNKPSLLAAITNVSAIGISLNPAQKLAYLVPRKNAICLDISYMGLMHLAQITGAIKWGQAIIVRDKDLFELNGIDNPPSHKFNPFGEERGDIVGAYVVVKTDTNDYLTTALPISKIFDIRDRSESYKAYQKDGRKCPWITDEEEMIKKTVVKNASKYWPRRERLDSAVHYLNEGEEGIRFEKEVTGESKILEDGTIKGSVHTGTDGVLESMNVSQQESLQARSNSIIEAANLEKWEEAYKFYDGVQGEERLALFAILKPHSSIRSRLKKMNEEANLREPS